MSYLKSIEPVSATGGIKAVYDQLKKHLGMVPNGMKSLSSSPFRLEAQARELNYFMNHPSLNSELTAAIRYTVASDHGCEYCVIVNGGMLQQKGWPKETVAALPKNPETAKLSAKDKALFLLVVKAVRTPKEVQVGDIQELRALGWDDQDIMDAVSHGAYSIAFDTLLSAFGVVPDR